MLEINSQTLLCKRLMRMKKIKENPVPINILYIEDTIGLGGSLVSLYHLLQYLDRGRYRPYVVLYHKNQEIYLKERCKKVETFVARPKETLKSSIMGKRFLKLTMLFGNLGKRVGYFIISVTDFLIIILPYAVRIALIVRRYHIHLVHLNTGVCIPGIIVAKFLKVPCVATQRGPEWVSFITRLFARYVTFYMANSEATKRDLLGLGIRTTKISVVYPPVDLKKFDFNIDAGEKKKEFNMCSDGLSFGIIGNLYEGKGQKIVLQAAVEVLKVFPHCRIFIIGDDPEGNDQYKKELEAYANRLGIAPNVIFTGFRRDVPELIQVLDSVVHASLFPEPFGKVIIEGMAMKKPVIATRSDGTTEIIDDGVNGFLIPPNDHKVLAQKLICVLRDEDLRRKLGEAALLKVKNNFTIEKHIKEVEKTYEGILKGAGRG